MYFPNNRTRLLITLVVVLASVAYLPKLLPQAFANPQIEDVEFEEEAEPEDLATLQQELDFALAEAKIDALRLEFAERRLALVRELAAVTEDRVAGAAYGLMRIGDTMEDAEATEFLRELLEETSNAEVKRLIQIRLMEFDYQEDDLELRKQNLKRLILAD